MGGCRLPAAAHLAVKDAAVLLPDEWTSFEAQHTSTMVCKGALQPLASCCLGTYVLLFELRVLVCS